MEKLKFVKTWGVEEFKQQHNVETIEVKRNEETGKCFIVYGFETGAVSEAVNNGTLTSPVISEVCSPDTTGEMFLLIHQRGVGAATLLTL